jgi:ribosomal protein S18 acetylase RimI-like enzyme
MSTRQPIPLTAVLIQLGDPEFQAILAWQFPAEPFYEAQVQQVLKHDVPHRVIYNACAIWIYRDAHGNIVGFGTIDFCREYEQFTAGKQHFYIPVLAVNPAFQRRGHGRTIVEHLISEAALIAQLSDEVSNLLFLDVYSANKAATALYAKCGFAVLNPDNPILDPAENNETYFVMAKRISIAAGI